MQCTYYLQYSFYCVFTNSVDLLPGKNHFLPLLNESSFFDFLGKESWDFFQFDIEKERVFEPKKSNDTLEISIEVAIARNCL